MSVPPQIRKKFDPIDQLIQHVKGSDTKLYLALKRLSDHIVDTNSLDNPENIESIGLASLPHGWAANPNYVSATLVDIAFRITPSRDTHVAGFEIRRDVGTGKFDYTGYFQYDGSPPDSQIYYIRLARPLVNQTWSFYVTVRGWNGAMSALDVLNTKTKTKVPVLA